MINNELRATVSSGFTRPPTKTGIFPNLERSTSSFATLGGIQLPAIQNATTAKMIQGMNRFMSRPFSVYARNRPDGIQIARVSLPRRSRRRHKARESSDCARPEEWSRDRPVEIRPDKKFRRDSEAGDSCR